MRSIAALYHLRGNEFQGAVWICCLIRQPDVIWQNRTPRFIDLTARWRSKIAHRDNTYSWTEVASRPVRLGEIIGFDNLMRFVHITHCLSAKASWSSQIALSGEKTRFSAPGAFYHRVWALRAQCVSQDVCGARYRLELFEL